LKVSPGITDDQWLKLKTVFDVPDKARSFIDEIIALYRDYKDEHKGLTSAELTSQLLHVENQVRELKNALKMIAKQKRVLNKLGSHLRDAANGLKKGAHSAKLSDITLRLLNGVLVHFTGQKLARAEKKTKPLMAQYCLPSRCSNLRTPK
jgi:hypothetical protein